MYVKVKLLNFSAEKVNKTAEIVNQSGFI